MIRTHDGRPGILADVQSALRRRDHLGGRRPATMADYVALLWALVIAGTDTPGTVAAQAVWFAVLDGSYPEVDGRAAAARVAAEGLRYYPPSPRPLMRVMREVSLGDDLARPGEWIELHLPAMNRDPAVFADPHAYDPGRPDAAAARTFGGGAHRCIGNHLGMRIDEHLLVTLRERFHTLSPLPGHAYVRHGGLLHRLEHLPMTTAAAPR
jgi:cytochrome P450